MTNITYVSNTLFKKGNKNNEHESGFSTTFSHSYVLHIANKWGTKVHLCMDCWDDHG